MASFSMEDFVGNGALKGLLPKLLEQGWDDVPTLKIMNSEDMDAINMTQGQKVALEIRSYLHDRALMQYGDRLEASGKCLPELLSLSMGDLSSQFGMKRGHVARFTDRTSSCANPLLTSYALPARKGTTAPSRNNSNFKSELGSATSRKMHSMMSSTTRKSTSYDPSVEQSMAEFKIKDRNSFKGIVAAMPAEPRACGCVKPPPVVENVAPYSPMKASELWRDKPAILLCIRRPGYIFIDMPLLDTTL